MGRDHAQPGSERDVRRLFRRHDRVLLEQAFDGELGMPGHAPERLRVRDQPLGCESFRAAIEDQPPRIGSRHHGGEHGESATLLGHKSERDLGGVVKDVVAWADLRDRAGVCELM